jgi:2-desacetyl-2-hydroxyethyl bacteriochlorophyllide A dehydrogenase
MKALVCTKPCLFEYKDIPAPKLQKGNAILKIKRIGICGTDLHAYKGTQPYFNYPRILGHELAAELIDADNADDFLSGEAVTFIPYFNCGECVACRNNKPNCCVQIKVAGVHINGGMCEYFSVPSSSLIKSNGLNYDELAVVEPLAIGAHGIRLADMKPGEFVLIIGAGPIGFAAIQFAKLTNATIIIMDVNEQRLQFCKQKLNIEHTLNPSTGNVLDKLRNITNGDMANVVIDATGNQKAINNALQYLSHGGKFILIGLQNDELIFSHPEFHKREATLKSSRNATKEDFITVINSIEKGLVNPSDMITHKIDFDDLKNAFETWLYTTNNLVKALVKMD